MSDTKMKYATSVGDRLQSKRVRVLLAAVAVLAVVVGLSAMPVSASNAAAPEGAPIENSIDATQPSSSPVLPQADGELVPAGKSFETGDLGYGTVEAGSSSKIGGGDSAKLAVEFWVKPDADSDEDAWIIRKNNAWGVQWTGTGEERKIFFKADGFRDGVTSNRGVPAGVWTHVAVVYDGSNANMYLNGELDSSFSAESPSSSDSRIRFGANDAGNGQFFVGNLDNVRFWDTSRSLVEVKTSRFEELDGTESGLVHLYQFDGDSSGGPATDGAGTANITITGDEIVDGDSNPVAPHVHATPLNGSARIDLAPRTGSDSVTGNDADEYRLYRSSGPDPATASLVTTLQPSTTEYTDQNVSNGLTYYYWSTAVINNREGDYSKAATVRAYGKTEGVPAEPPIGGQGGDSLALGGLDYATISDRPSLSIGGGDNAELAVEFWVKPDADSDDNAWILRKKNAWGAQWTGTGEERKVFFKADGFNRGITSNGGVQAGVWTHVAVVYDGSNVNMYLNGELDKSIGYGDGPPGNSGNDLQIGSNDAANDRFFHGQIDDLRLWDTSRGSSQIEQNYTSELTGSEPGLAGYWKFDTFESDTTRGSTFRHGKAVLNGDTEIADGGAYPLGTETYVKNRNNETTVSWTVRTASTPEEFAVWRKDASADESGWALIERIEDRSARSYVDESASNGANYHYAVTTTNKDLQESDFARGAPARPYDARGGGALSLDGTEDTRGEVTDRPSLSIGGGDNAELAVEFWVKPDADSDDNAWILRKKNAWGAQWTGTGEERKVFFKADGFNRGITSNGGVQAGVWTHVAVVYDGSNVNMYLNGELDKSIGYGDGPPGNSGNDLQIGSNDAANDRFFVGQIDEIALWDVSRSADEVARTYNDRLRGNETGLVHYWQFDEQGAEATRSTSGRHATVQLRGQAAVESPGAMPVTPRVYARADDESATVSWRVRNLAETAEVGIYRSTQRDLSDRTQITTADAVTESQYTDTGLSNGQTRFYQVTAFNTDSQESDYAFEAGALPSEQTGGNAFEFLGNGSSSYATLSDRPSIDVAGNNQFAIEFWINPDAGSDDNAWIVRKAGAWGVELQGSGAERKIHFIANAVGSDGITSSSTIQAGEWTHVAITHDGSNQNIYLNGELDDSNNGDPPGTSGGQFLLAANDARNQFFFDGQLDELRVWDSSRTQSEIRRNYDNELAGSETDLEGYWRGPFTTDNNSVTGNARKPMTLGLNNVGYADSGIPIQSGGVDTTTVNVTLSCAPDGLTYYQARLNATSGEPIRSIEGGPEFGKDSVSVLEGGPGVSSVTAAGEFSSSNTVFQDPRVLFSVEYEGVVNQSDVDLTAESLRGGDGEITNCDLSADADEPESPGGGGDETFDFGVEVQAEATVAQGGDVPITAFVNNRASEEVDDVTTELLVDQNQDGSFGSSEVVASLNVDYSTGVRSVDLTYSDVQLQAGQYSYQARLSKDGEEAASFTNGTLEVTSGSSEAADFSIEIVDQQATVQQGGSVDITTSLSNSGSQSASGVLKLIVDQDRDGVFEADESVDSRTVTLNSGGTSDEDLTYSGVQLMAGTYSYQARISTGSQTTESFTNGTLNVTTSTGSDATLSLSPSSVPIGNVSDTANATLTLEADTGVATADANVSINTPSAVIRGASGEVSSSTSSYVEFRYNDIRSDDTTVELGVIEFEMTQNVQTDVPISVEASNVTTVSDLEPVDLSTEAQDGTLRLGAESVFTQPLIDQFNAPPTNTRELDDTLYEDLDGDGDGKEIDQTVTLFGEIIRGTDLGLSDQQARLLDWSGNSPDEVTVEDMVTLFGKQIRAE
jgi:hypothetical protein